MLLQHIVKESTTVTIYGHKSRYLTMHCYYTDNTLSMRCQQAAQTLFIVFQYKKQYSKYSNDLSI